MDMSDIVKPESIIPSLRATSKKQALQELSRRMAPLIAQDETVIFDILLEREKLGTTGVGTGIAIPHGKLPGLDRIHGMFARLENVIDFDSVDEQPVDLIFMLLAPEAAGADHLKALARVSRLLRDSSICEKLRQAETGDQIYALLTKEPAGNAA